MDYTRLITYLHRMQDDLIDKSNVKSLFCDLSACIPFVRRQLDYGKEQHFLCNAFIIFGENKKTFFLVFFQGHITK